MRKLGLFLVLIGCVSSVPLAMAGNCQDRTDVVIVEVKIGETITVSPEKAEIWLDTDSRPTGKPVRVCWVVEGLPEEMTLHMGAKNEGAGQLNPRYSIKSTRASKSRGTDTARLAGTWGYSVWITETGKKTPRKMVDPEIIINEGLGGGRRP